MSKGHVEHLRHEQEDKVYYCIWDNRVQCKIRTQYKLKPESLVQFCAICTELPLHKKKLS